MQICLLFLREHVPFFAWRVDKLNSKDYLLPLSRTRVFLQGLRDMAFKPGFHASFLARRHLTSYLQGFVCNACHFCLFPQKVSKHKGINNGRNWLKEISSGTDILKKNGMTEVPPPLPPFGQLSIREMLKKNLPPTPRDSLTKSQRNNLIGYEKSVKKQLKDGILSPGSVVICQLGRGFGKPYPPRMSVDISPCLTTHLRHLFILSVGDVHKPDHDREFCRRMLPQERLSLQGCEPAVATTLRGDHLVRACGNAYPVNLLAACMVPMLNALAASSLLTPSDAAPKTYKYQPGEGGLGLPDCRGFFQEGLRIKVARKKPPNRNCHCPATGPRKTKGYEHNIKSIKGFETRRQESKGYLPKASGQVSVGR